MKILLQKQMLLFLEQQSFRNAWQQPNNFFNFMRSNFYLQQYTIKDIFTNWNCTQCNGQQRLILKYQQSKWSMYT